MQGLQSWCYSLFLGVIFSGIVLLLTPEERFRPMMQLILGAFLLVCMLTWGKSVKIPIKIDTDDAERQRLQTAQQTKDYFTQRIQALSQELLDKTAGEYLSEYGIKQGEFQIYMQTEENADGTERIYLLLRLPRHAAENTAVISRALSYQLGADVRIETYGTDNE